MRAIPIDGYRAAGARIEPENAWPTAPAEAIIFGLKELPEDGTPLRHRHILFGHAYKGQPAGQVLLKRFKAGGGTLYDLEYLVDDDGRRVAAFGYWAGYAGAAVSLKCWAAQQRGGLAGRSSKYPGKAALIADLARETAGSAARAPSSSARSAASAPAPPTSVRRSVSPPPSGTWPKPRPAARSPRCCNTRFSSTPSSPAPAARCSCPHRPRRRRENSP